MWEGMRVLGLFVLKKRGNSILKMKYKSYYCCHDLWVFFSKPFFFFFFFLQKEERRRKQKH